MGVKYSDTPLVFRTDIRSDSSGHLRADLDDALGAAGWTDKTAITGGYQYTIASPQSLVAKVKIWDSGEGNLINVQFVSEDELKEGKIHKLMYGGGFTAGYQIVANACQMFVSVPGKSTEAVDGRYRYSVAGGIPYVAAPVDSECSAEEIEDSATSRIFWSCGAGSNAFAATANFRNSRYCFRDYSHLWNNALYVASDSQAANATIGQLSLYPLTPTNNVDQDNLPRVTKYGSGDPLAIDALIGWEWNIRGQVYDAFMLSRDRTLDEQITTVETDAAGAIRSDRWIGWNYGLPGAGGGTYYATLYLLIDSLGEGHNVAY